MPDTSIQNIQSENSVKMASKPIKILPNSTSTLSNNDRPSVVQQEWKLEVLTEKNNNNVKSHAISTTTDARVIQTKSSVFQKWAAIELEAHRPLAKRQLSAESSVRSCMEVKKSTLRREHGGGPVKATSSHLQPKLRENSSATQASTWQNARVSKRKLRKELFSSSEVFGEMDTCTISTGKTLRSQGIFSIRMITRAITEGAPSELEKVRTIWIWLCQNIEYDVSGYLGLTDKLCEPERVVEMGRGVCCGYSSVFLQMCQEAGIQCKEVSGHGKGIGYRQGLSYQNSKSSHMWNAVLLGGHWYLLDACWGAGRVDMDNKVFIKRYDDFYFLTDPEDFINSHCPDEAEWQLLDVPVPLQEFEKRVLRTSEFYRMELMLQHPKHFLLLTENGEASVSIKFPKSVDFTYQISQRSASEPVEVSSSSGLLTVTRDTMSLRLMPPASGTYDVMIFARPGSSSGTFTWVCSFLLECSEPKASEELPENPFVSWGLQRTTESLGVSRCSHGAEPVVLETGTLQLDLLTSRPLMMLCELTHKSLDPSTSKRCLATQIEPDKMTCHVLCPYLGYYRLSVFVRDYERIQEGFQNVGNFVLHCAAGAVNLNELFPSFLSTSCGPGIRTQGAGLSKFSHTGALVSTQQGKCNITFQSQPDLELHAVLFKDQRRRPGHPLSRHVFFTHNSGKVTVSVALPESGVYKLGLYSKTSTNQDFSPLCDFVLRNSCESSLPPFPCTYAAWRKGSVLLEPRQGLLEPLSWVHFRVRVPGARRVSVLAEQLVELQLNKSRVWEGEVFTGAGVSQVKLAASVGGTSKDMAIIMCFDVLGQQNEM
ncbi:lim and transglutaminase domain protein ltd-1-like [Osmerus eperlanus]|uniref:lim and transglutaminase domain protein ltd-1-like n=1 Tax=Osmerus eperlanus TaxID=29151 RepID=UPI002E1373ED